jgi:hypothetical protein
LIPGEERGVRREASPHERALIGAVFLFSSFPSLLTAI